MCVEIFGIIDGVNLYIDPLMEDGKVIKGRKQGVVGNTFMVSSPNTAKQLYNIFVMKNRKEKIKKIYEKYKNR